MSSLGNSIHHPHTSSSYTDLQRLESLFPQRTGLGDHYAGVGTELDYLVGN